MPLVHVRSLPFDPPVDVPSLLRRLNSEMAEQLGVPPHTVSATWQTVEPGHYAVGSRTECRQRPDTHPLLVELVVAGGIESADVEQLLGTIADALVERTRVAPENVFIQVRRLASGEVYETGRVRYW